MGNFLKRFGSGKSRSRSSRSMSLGTTSSQSHEPSPSADPPVSLADKINAAKKKYALIPDRFSSLDQVHFFFVSCVDLTFGFSTSMFFEFLKVFKYNCIRI